MSSRLPSRVSPRAAVLGIAAALAITLTVGLAPVSSGAPAVGRTPGSPAASTSDQADRSSSGSDDYTTSEVLPFEKPSTSALRASEKKVFANWVVSLPVSLDNLDPSVDYYTRHYLDPDGENGKHRAYGGYLRDRPLGRAPLSGDWRLEDLKHEVRQAISVGIDGFTMVIYSMPSNPTSTADQTWNTARLMMKAAAAVDPGFTIIPMPDMYALNGIGADKLAANLAYLAGFSSIHRLADGRALYSPFYPELKSADWWGGWLSTMENTQSTPSALWPTFLNEQPTLASFGPHMIGAGNWGSRHPNANPTTSTPGMPKWRIQKVHEAGELWMQPVSIQDDRPREGKFVEALNTTNLRNTWDIAIDGDADWVQLLTWNDLPESTGILPSLRHGWTFLDLMSYYITWFKTGQAPAITKDAIYLTHRAHWVDDKPSYPQTILSKNSGDTPSRDAIEAMVFLTAPATVTITTNASAFTCNAPAGLSTCVAPLGAGTIRAEVVRNGAVASSITSTSKVTHSPYVQDLQYVGASSLREGYTAPRVIPPAPDTETTTALRPSADTFVNRKRRNKNYDRSPKLMTRGTKGAISYLRFAVPPAPAGTTLTSATLEMRTSGVRAAGSVDPATVSTFTADWSVSDITWRNRPRNPLTSVGELPGGTRPDRSYDVALTAAAVAAAEGGSLNLAVTSDGTDNLKLWTTAHSVDGHQPELVLVYG